MLSLLKAIVVSCVNLIPSSFTCPTCLLHAQLPNNYQCLTCSSLVLVVHQTAEIGRWLWSLTLVQGRTKRTKTLMEWSNHLLFLSVRCKCLSSRKFMGLKILWKPDSSRTAKPGDLFIYSRWLIWMSEDGERDGVAGWMKEQESVLLNKSWSTRTENKSWKMAPKDFDLSNLSC